jgi:hypothetical protein
MDAGADYTEGLRPINAGALFVLKHRLTPELLDAKLNTARWCAVDIDATRALLLERNRRWLRRRARPGAESLPASR